MRPTGLFGRSILVLALVGTMLIGSAEGASAKALNLKPGSRGAAVLTVERGLYTLGLLPARAVDRRYTVVTKRAVKRFQRSHRIRATGKVNRRTLNAVKRAAAARVAQLRAQAAAQAAAAKRPLIKPIILGHRGAVLATIPENTLESMQYATGIADILEFDLRLTSDHEWVLMHDSTLDRTTDCTGEIATWTLQDLQDQCRVDTVPGAPVTIPTFESVAEYAASVGANIAPQLAVRVSDAQLDGFLDILDVHRLRPRTAVQSFFPEQFQRIRQRDASMPLIYLTGGVPTPAAVRESGASIVGPKIQDMNSARVQAYQQAGLKVWPYTAWTVPQLRAVRDMGANGVFTDIPAEARALYGR